MPPRVKSITLVGRDGSEVYNLDRAAWLYIVLPDDKVLNLTVRSPWNNGIWIEDVDRTQGDPHPDDDTRKWPEFK